MARKKTLEEKQEALRLKEAKRQEREAARAVKRAKKEAERDARKAAKAEKDAQKAADEQHDRDEALKYFWQFAGSIRPFIANRQMKFVIFSDLGNETNFRAARWNPCTHKLELLDHNRYASLGSVAFLIRGGVYVEEEGGDKRHPADARPIYDAMRQNQNDIVKLKGRTTDNFGSRPDIGIPKTSWNDVVKLALLYLTSDPVRFTPKQTGITHFMSVKPTIAQTWEQASQPPPVENKRWWQRVEVLRKEYPEIWSGQQIFPELQEIMDNMLGPYDQCPPAFHWLCINPKGTGWNIATTAPWALAMMDLFEEIQSYRGTISAGKTDWTEWKKKHNDKDPYEMWDAKVGGSDAFRGFLRSTMMRSAMAEAKQITKYDDMTPERFAELTGNPLDKAAPWGLDRQNKPLKRHAAMFGCLSTGLREQFEIKRRDIRIIARYFFNGLIRRIEGRPKTKGKFPDQVSGESKAPRSRSQGIAPPAPEEIS